MLREEQNRKTREEVKKAWAEGDLAAILKAGFDNFMSILFDNPLSFDTFLDYTGQFFDEFIRKTTAEEHLRYVGGKIKFKLNGPTCADMTADFYFQTPGKQWVMKQKTGRVDRSRFSDWDTAPNLLRLRKDGALEFEIDAPTEAKPTWEC